MGRSGQEAGIGGVAVRRAAPAPHPRAGSVPALANPARLAETPPAVIDRLLKDTRAALKSPDVHQSLLSQGAEPGGQSPAEFGAYFQAEIRKWAKVIKSAGIKLEQ